jgi:LuxR family transcriptional regulator, quorum-sensing system regulator BjaR1
VVGTPGSAAGCCLPELQRMTAYDGLCQRSNMCNLKRRGSMTANQSIHLSGMADAASRTAGLTKFVRDLDDALEITEASSRFQMFIEELGFMHATYCKVPRSGEPFVTCLITSTAPRTWLDRYIEEDYARFDPLIRHSSVSPKPFFYSEIFDSNVLDPGSAQVQHARHAAGVYDNFVVPIRNDFNQIVIVSYSSESVARIYCKATLALAANYYHNKISALRNCIVSSEPLLTEREIECLKWAAHGKTDWEIGSILGVDNKTVNYRIERAKKKIGVPTRVQAIIYAIRHCGI